MPVDPQEAERLKKSITEGTHYTFDEWIQTTADLQTIAFGRDPALIPLGDEFKDFARWNTMAAVAELCEFLEEVPWKPWATNLQLNRSAALGEIVDAMHFIANLLRMLEVSGTELTVAYQTKQLKNLHRQIDGYDGKKEKCGYCNRELDSWNPDQRLLVQYPDVKFCNEDHANKYKETKH